MGNIFAALFVLAIVFLATAHAAYGWAFRRFAKGAPTLWLQLFPCHWLARQSLGCMGAHLYVAHRQTELGAPVETVFPQFVRGASAALSTYEWEYLGGPGSYVGNSAARMIDRTYRVLYEQYEEDLFRFLRFACVHNPQMFRDAMREFHHLRLAAEDACSGASMHERLTWQSPPEFQYRPVDASKLLPIP